MSAAQSLVHLAWWRRQSERRLIFGWVETLPSLVPAQRGHPFVSLPVKPDKAAYIYVARFPIPADEAETWFAEAQAGNLKLPSHPDKPTAGDRQALLDPPSRVEPDGGGESIAMGLPFLPAVHGAVYVRGLFGNVVDEVIAQIGQVDAAHWLMEWLFFDLREHPEYLGSLMHTRYDPTIRDVERHLSKRSDGEDELIRLTTWPGTELDGMEIIAIERRPFGLSDPMRVKVRGSLATVRWPRRVEHTGLAILDAKQQLCWWSDPIPFIRSIGVDMAISGRRRQIKLTTEGRHKESYNVTEKLRDQARGPIVVGKTPDFTSPSAVYYAAEARRHRRRLSANLGVQWFDDPITAATAIRSIIGEARERVWIIDPYFAGVEIVRFALAVTSRFVDVEIITSAEHLRTRAKGVGSREEGDVLAEVIEQLPAGQPINLLVKVMLGKSAPIHDRFLIIDDQVWFSGNSLNAIGERASLLLRVPNAEDTLSRLAPITEAAVMLDQWIVERRLVRTRSGVASLAKQLWRKVFKF